MSRFSIPVRPVASDAVPAAGQARPGLSPAVAAWKALDAAAKEEVVLVHGRAIHATRTPVTLARLAARIGVTTQAIAPVARRLRDAGRCPWPPASPSGRPRPDVAPASYPTGKAATVPGPVSEWRRRAWMVLNPADSGVPPRSRGDDPRVIAAVRAYLTENRKLRRRRPEWWHPIRRAS